MFDPPISEQNIDLVPRSTRSKDHHEDHHTHDHVHDPSVSFVNIVCEGNLDLEKANIWLGTLLFERSEDIYRMKGLLSVQGMKERFVFQDFGALKMPTLIFLHQVYMATQAFQLAQIATIQLLTWRSHLLLSCMDSHFTTPTPSESHPETMDFLSLAWCNFAVQAFQPDQQDRSVVLLDDPIVKFESHNKSPYAKLHKMDDADLKLPPWKYNDMKSFIWTQQAMHPELNYNGFLRKKRMSWKMVPFKNMSIKKWLKDIKRRRKEEHRLQRAEVHAAISMAGVAAALAAIAAEKSENDESSTAKEAAVASAAALVAAQCAKVAEAMGARKEQLSSVIGSAMNSTSASDILTLSAAATTSLKGAATLKERTGCCNKRLNGTAPVMPTKDNPEEVDFDFEKYRSMLATGAQLTTETPDGKYTVRWVSVIINNEAKVLVQMRKLGLLKSKKECIILDMHAELYKDSEAGENGTGYLIVLTTSKGTIKLDMEADYQRYKTWATTINHMLLVSTSFTKYHLQYYKN